FTCASPEHVAEGRDEPRQLGGELAPQSLVVLGAFGHPREDVEAARRDEDIEVFIEPRRQGAAARVALRERVAPGSAIGSIAALAEQRAEIVDPIADPGVVEVD